MSTWLLAAALATAAPTRATLDGQFTGEAIHWDLVWDGTGRDGEVRFASPLPAEARVNAPEETLLRDADGRVVAFDPLYGSGVRITVPQTVGAPILAVPLLADPVEQRVIVDGLDFVPDRDLKFDKHTRYWATPALEGAGRKAFERSLPRPRRASPWDQAVYLHADSRFVRAGGIPGQLRPEGQTSLAVHALLGSVLIALLVGAALLYKGLEHLARSERNDAYIRGAFGGSAGEGKG